MNIINNLKIWQKLSAICLLFVVPILILLYLLVSEKNIAIKFTQKELIGTNYLRPLNELIGGLSTLRLSLADKGNAGKTTAMVAQIDLILGELEQIERKYGKELKTSVQFQEFNGKWQEWKSQKVQENIVGLIANIMELIGIVGDNSNLILDPDLDTYYLMDNVVVHLNETTDIFQQIGVLTYITIKHQILTSDEKTQFVVLTGLFKSRLDYISKHLNIAFKENPLGNVKTKLENHLTNYASVVNTLLDLINNKVLKSDTIILNKEEFTLALNNVTKANNDLWQGAINELDVLLQERINSLNYKKYIALVTVAIVMLCSFMLVYVLIRSITIPLRDGIELAHAIAKRNMSAEGTNTYRKNEISMLGMELNNMKDSLTEMIEQVATLAEDVSNASETLKEHVFGIIHRISESKEKSLTVATSASDMSRSVSEIAKNTSNIASSTVSTLNNALEGKQVVNKTITEVKGISSTVSTSAQIITNLGERSKQIGAIINVINDIADQTNLLALNAAIEAARAGEQGRGFAVVADEVRKLAEKTSKATLEISQMIASIQCETEKAVSSMKAGLGQMEEGVNLTTSAGNSLDLIVRNVNDLQSKVESIATATEAMSAAAEQVTIDIETVSRMTTETHSFAEEINRATLNLSSLSSSLNELTHLWQSKLL
ncbi:MAG: methyl-accepting chemotaxis protein [Candidatus Magnetoovum sp. WYHC-5]|nr:methyl-accepting chemotaxis protein [Candidatus Magnetoovum sp. WYHC-5]